MAKIFRHRAMRSDEHVGHIDKDGRVYREKFGPDEYIGRVDFASGKVYAHRTGIDDYLGSVTAEGKIYGHQFGPDKYQASVNAENKIFANKSMARDDYVGWVEEMTHPVEAAAAWFLFFANESDEV
jgi:hypothetical protein